ncbi:MAG: CoA transferase [Dehalococcoidia bacterium]|nr:CoA transferase [Dehalococcoidia bacterium]
MAEQALKDLKVLDFSRVIAGPLLTQLLALHGATVVRIESNHFLDRLRISAPYAGKKMGLNRSGYFSLFNANKYSMTLNLNHRRAPELMKHLVGWCDVLVENFVPGAMEKRGFGYEDLRKIKPDLIMLSTSNQGRGGPLSRWGGYGYTLMALTGVTNLTGWEDRACSHPFGALSDMICPSLEATALLAAIEHRRRTGKGQHLDLSQFEATLFYLSPLLVDYITSGNEFTRMGNKSLCAAPHGCYPCKGEDRWCAITVENDEEWAVFCRVIGKPELVNDSRFSSFESRKANEPELNEIVSGWTRGKTDEEVMMTLQEAGIAAGVVQNPADIFKDPQLAHQGHFQMIEHPEMGYHSYEMPPFTLSATPARLNKPAPCLGQDNEYVCTKLLGLSDEEFLGLLKENVFE